MNLHRQTYKCLFSLFVLALQFSLTAQVTIIESQSYNVLHRMDIRWETAANELGLSATIQPQSALDNLANFSNTEVLIVASGVIPLNSNQLLTLERFVKNGGNLYVQGEYLMGAQGNNTFKQLVTKLGGSFQWNGETNGQLSPLALSSVVSQQDSLRYFWYGAHGTGDENIIPFIKKNGLHYAFIYCPTRRDYGKVMTISDQDWIRLNKNKQLLEELLYYLNRYQAMVQSPQILIESSVDRPCNGETIEFYTQLSDTTGYETYQWLVNGQPVIGATGQQWTYANYQDGDVVECQLSLDYGCGSYEKVSNQFLIDPVNTLFAEKPVVNPVAASICAGQVARFWAQVDLRNGINNPRYQWLLNGNPIPNSNHLNLTVNSFNATDSVQFVMTYDNDCRNNIQLTSTPIGLEVTELVTPEVILTADRTQICEDETITFSVSGSNWGNNPVFIWTVDGQSVNGNTASFITNNLVDGQVVNVQLIPEIACPSAAVFPAAPISIEVNTIETPEVSITRLDSETCEGRNFSFAAIIKNGGNAPVIEWLVNGQNTGYNGMTFTTNTLLNGDTVTARLLSSASCISSDEVTSNTINVALQTVEEPAVTITRMQSMVCPGEESNFEAIGIHLGNEPVYEWLVDGQATGTNSSYFSQVLEPRQEVRCIVLSNKACVGNIRAVSNSLTPSINDLNIRLEEVVPATCMNDNGYAEVSVTGGVPPYQYNWNHGASTALVENLAAGEYQLTVTDFFGCQAELNVTVIGETMPELTELVLEQPDCYRSEGNATARIENENYYNYSWYNENDELVSEAFYVFNLTPGYYELVVSTPHGCTTSYPFEILPGDQLQFELPEKVQTKEGEAVVLDPVITPVRSRMNYSWFPAAGLSCSDCPNPVAQPATTTVYTLSISTESGCNSSREIIVEVAPNLDCYIPNIFSPNGDGYNDFFTAYGGEQTEEIVRLHIYDRWGNEAFGGENLPMGLEQAGWNGTLKGKDVPPGVYVYALEVRFKSGRIVQFSGDVTLVR